MEQIKSEVEIVADFFRLLSLAAELYEPLKIYQYGLTKGICLLFEEADQLDSLIFNLKQLEDVEIIYSPKTCKAFNLHSTKSILPGKVNILDLNGYNIDTQKILAEIILASFFGLIRCGQFPEIDAYHIFLDECQRFSYDANGSICQLLREGRKFHIHLLLATQTFSTFSKDALAVLNQAATRLYFRPSQTDIHKISKALSPTEWQIWKVRLANLKVGECIASGIFDVNGQEISRPLLLH